MLPQKPIGRQASNRPCRTGTTRDARGRVVRLLDPMRPGLIPSPAVNDADALENIEEELQPGGAGHDASAASWP